MTGEFMDAAAGFPGPFRLLVRGKSGSTNDDLQALAKDGAEEGLVLMALEQTAGRGRRGAVWFSPPGESLAFSILLRPAEPKALWPRFALVAGLSVAQALESFGPACGIKWPNDVWIGGRKVAGILVEAGEGHVVVGIGVNVNNRRFPDEVAASATSLRIETGLAHSGPEVLAAVIRRFAVHCREIDRGFAEIVRAVRERCVLAGQRVSLIASGGRETGTVESIAPDGGLLLRTGDGVRHLMQADEIRLLA